MSSSWDSSTTTNGFFSATETAYSLFASDQSSNVLSPFKVLQDLITTLRTNNVPGPFLLRMETEFTQELGEGAYAEVRAPDELTQRRFYDARDGGDTRSLAGAAGLIAVKQHKSRKQGPPTPSEAPTFLASHFKDAMREILALTHPGLRHHPNIVKLMGWGLCLDALEDADLGKANIPLLVLEKAHGDMSQVLLRDREVNQIGFERRLGLCRDIGKGLQALHDNGLTHGDLKTANILVFATPAKLIAKLCDFGTINYKNVNQAASDPHSRYRGTPGWRPPEVLQPTNDDATDEAKLVRCDVFTYGLVIWSIFVGHGKTCVQDENLHTLRGIQEHAIRSLKSELRATAPSREMHQLVGVLSASLCFDSTQRDLRPWSRLLTTREHMLKNILAAKGAVQCSSSYICLPNLRHLTSKWQIRDLPSGLQSLLWSRRKGPLFAHDKIEAYRQFAQSAGFSNDIHAGEVENSNDDPHSLATLEHQDGQCLGMEWFGRVHANICSFFEKDELLLASRDDITQRKKALYCYARYRSRVKLCCWTPFGEENVVGAFLSRGTNYYEFAILAWLCRGEVGAREVSELTTVAFTRGCCDKTMDDSRKLEIFLLLMQSGLPIESSFANPLRHRLTHPRRRASPELNSVLITFVRALKKASRGTAIRLICERFLAASRSTQIRDATKDFMLGREDRMGVDIYAWTALHEFAAEANYEGVKHLIDIGANTRRTYRTSIATQAMPDGATPLSVAVHFNPPNRVSKLAKERVLALLRRTSNSTLNLDRQTSRRQSDYASTRALSVNDTLPQGWTSSEVGATSTELPQRSCGGAVHLIGRLWAAMKDNVRAARGMSSRRRRPHRTEEVYWTNRYVYKETFTGSLTFKRPRFSLLASGRAALGYRNVQGYSLDLVSFLEPPTSTTTKRSIEARFPLIDDDWYRAEPLTAAMTDNPLGDLTEPWTNPFSIPRLDFRGVSIPRVQLELSDEANTLLASLFGVVSFVVILVLLWKYGPLLHNH